ncbi:MAG: RNA pyrophosphohydrolase [Gammaproteobacteria bacterium]|nr:RNA pyrophosphohydrolase [Gammaproteobacteria bacterium]
MIDIDGYRANVGVIICNTNGQVMWAKRIKQNAWQFPQGGVDANESAIETMYRELWEETGLEESDVALLKSTNTWYRYKLPKRMVRPNTPPVCIGQKQKWFLLQLTSPDSHVNLAVTETPEFEQWKWVDYWLPSKQVVGFKRRVYLCMLNELSPYLPKPSSS